MGNCGDNCNCSCGENPQDSGYTGSNAENPNNTEATDQTKTGGRFDYTVNVRYGKMAVQESFLTNISDLRVGQMVVMKSERGIDFGDVTAKPEKINEKTKTAGSIMRAGTCSDKNILSHIRTHKEPEELEFCKSKIKERKLPMKLAGIEHLFGGDKVIFYFLADGRVDFRELVKDLARRYRTRIEMRQIGVRDEARMLSDYEHCGRELCCRTFIHDLEPVTMRMAKMQKSTLDPNKISGHCGRLMCCLRFEDEVYKEHKKNLPYKGDNVKSCDHCGRVVNSDVLSQKVTIVTDNGGYETILASDITSREPSNKPSGNKNKKNNRDNKNKNDDRPMNDDKKDNKTPENK